MLTGLPSNMCAQQRLSMSARPWLSKMRPVKILGRLTNAQADLNLRWAYISEGTFSDVVAHVMFYEPALDKTNKIHVRPAKTQISLGIRSV